MLTTREKESNLLMISLSHPFLGFAFTDHI